jgi:UDP-N-acetylmuramate dehydrogenase
MTSILETASRLAELPNVILQRDVLLSEITRFGLGGPAALLVDATDENSFVQALMIVRESRLPVEVIGGGSNVVACDSGFPGVVLRYTAAEIASRGNIVTAGAGAVLQGLVDYTIAGGVSGIHTMTGIPGWVGGAIYGNAGAYGRSIDQCVISVRFFDGETIREVDNSACHFRYRSSTFKDNKGWVVLSTSLELVPADANELRAQADDILSIRNAKYPPTMKCAGSIFKNLLFADLPAHVRDEVDPKVIREGKVPSAYFLEKVGAKGIRNGDIHVADYHANLIYNAGSGTARQVREIVDDLKARVRERFRFDVEEEVQYVGFKP